jgi:hypothetical protein
MCHVEAIALVALALTSSKPRQAQAAGLTVISLLRGVAAGPQHLSDRVSSLPLNGVRDVVRRILCNAPVERP